MGFRDWLAWQPLRRRLKRFLKSAQGRPMYDFLSGSKTKIGAFGAFLVTVGTILARFTEVDQITVQFVLDAARDLFLALGGYGAVMKLVKIAKRKVGV